MLPREKALQSLPANSDFLTAVRGFLSREDTSPLGKLLWKVGEGQDLLLDEAQNAVQAIVSDEATDPLRAAFLAALQAKGETEDEIAAFAMTMRNLASPLGIEPSDRLSDTCGTGADGASTFNVSTGIVFILAACGLKIAKHGNRAITSKCGSADLLEALGAKIDLEPSQVRTCLEQTGVGFLFAPKFHTATRKVMTARKELASAGWKTVFNILGPLTNPARPGCQLLGVFKPELVRKMAGVLARMGTRRAVVVWGEVGGGKGIDEVSIVGATRCAELNESHEISDFSVEPHALGLNSATLDQIKGGTPQENKDRLLQVLGSGDPRPIKNFLTINAAAGLYASGKVKSLPDGAKLAMSKIEDGSALKKVHEFVEATHAA
ncbi:MAG: anthranilate phosphoribosyltransferase [Nitrospirae bacterium]|nr:anthranilate phosphoribosyltransferase [Nitrospirota bacterium]